MDYGGIGCSIRVLLAVRRTLLSTGCSMIIVRRTGVDEFRMLVQTEAVGVTRKQY